MTGRPISDRQRRRSDAGVTSFCKEMLMTDQLVVRREVQVAAPPATVFAFLTDPEKILSWMGADATSEAHPGGIYLVKGVGGDRGRAARGTFREVVPVHRLAYSFGWEGRDDVPPDSSLVEIDLIDRDGGTLLRMTHSGLPNQAQCASHSQGWAHYLGRLASAATGRDPGVDRGPPVNHEA
jgi:uncharacterized protein YndB with AHSA1/START domain